MKHACLLPFLFLFGVLSAQTPASQLSPDARISLMTVAPGEYVYSTFRTQRYPGVRPAATAGSLLQLRHLRLWQPNFASNSAGENYCISSTWNLTGVLNTATCPTAGA
ncbi:MAG: hypothetical protein IPL27_22485 [Lewinellaceae bacterium]|nr:hypothetical protein [Lewinellaceae bacterium]